MIGIIFLVPVFNYPKIAAGEVLPFPLVNETSSLIIEDSSFDGHSAHLKAALFADGSAEGDDSLIRTLRKARLEELVQLERGYPFLEVS